MNNIYNFRTVDFLFFMLFCFLCSFFHPFFVCHMCIVNLCIKKVVSCSFRPLWFDLCLSRKLLIF